MNELVHNTNQSISKIKNFVLEHIMSTLQSNGVDCVASVVDNYIMIITASNQVFIPLDFCLKFYFDFITGENISYFSEVIKELKSKSNV